MRRRQLLTAVAAIGSSTGMAQPTLRVIATFSILADMSRQVGGSLVQVSNLVGPDADVHMFEPRPADLRDLMKAGVLVENGLGLEGWLNRMTSAVGFKGTTVVAARDVKPRTMTEQGGVVSIDPHAWQDPRNAELYVATMADGFADADPANRSAYQETANGYAQQIRRTDTWIESRLATIPPDRRRIITTHDAFGYYGARYGIEFLAPEGISTEFEPSAKSVAALVAQIKREKIHAVFIENMTSPRMATMLAQETGAVLGGTVYSDALSPLGGPATTYIDMLSHNTTLFAQAMA